MMNNRKVISIIVAAGRGARAGIDDGPKQYRLLNGKTVLQRTLEAFLSHSNISHVITIIHPDDISLYAACAPKNPKLLAPVNGGATRQDSVCAGLEAIKDLSPSHVLIHDAARPFVDNAAISNVIAGLAEHDAVLPGVAIVDTMKKADGLNAVVETVSRDGMFAAQTPQGFVYPAILDAHRQAKNAERHDFTDDSALAEWAGHTVTIVKGSANNTKLTTQDDIERAQTQMASAIPDIRVGHGYDTHQLVTGDKIRLCGVDIEFDRKLSGHSDADVGLHALTDALLGTIAQGDIGSHFPPSDPQWKGADSDQFLAHAARLVSAAGGTITHCDVTIVCEAPKIGPHRDSMRAAMSDILGISIERISVKATTNERIGFIGREEGIVAMATATVIFTGSITL